MFSPLDRSALEEEAAAAAARTCGKQFVLAKCVRRADGRVVYVCAFSALDILGLNACPLKGGISQLYYLCP